MVNLPFEAGNTENIPSLTQGVGFTISHLVSAVDAARLSSSAVANCKRKIGRGRSCDLGGQRPAAQRKRRGASAFNPCRNRVLVPSFGVVSSPPLQRCRKRENHKRRVQAVHSWSERRFNIFEIRALIRLFLLCHAHACRDQHVGTTAPLAPTHWWAILTYHAQGSDTFHTRFSHLKEARYYTGPHLRCQTSQYHGVGVRSNQSNLFPRLLVFPVGMIQSRAASFQWTFRLAQTSMEMFVFLLPPL